MTASLSPVYPSGFSTRGDAIIVRCESCGHSWIAAYLPMVMAKIARLMKGLACPKCGAALTPQQ